MARLQLTLFKDAKRSQLFGGDTRGHRKIKRPVVTRRPMHVTMRAGVAKGKLSFLAPSHVRQIREIVTRLSHRYHVRVWDWANNGNHLHLCVQAQTRDGFSNFLRRLGCEVALEVTGARKGKPFGKFWDALVWTRVVQWGRDFNGVLDYIFINQCEASGIPRLRARAMLGERARAWAMLWRGRPAATPRGETFQV